MIELLPPRLRSHILVDDCWIWTGYVDDRTGYGKTTIPPHRTRNVHRLVYELLLGVVPKGRELHHSCRNRRCCNPEHLRVVTRAEHHQLEPSMTAFCRDKTHCPYGHPLDGIRGDKKRYCKTCNRERAHKNYYRKKVL